MNPLSLNPLKYFEQDIRHSSNIYMDWSGGSVVKGTCCSSRGFRGNSEHPVPGDLMPSTGLCEHETCMWYADIHAGKTLIHIQKNPKRKTFVENMTFCSFREVSHSRREKGGASGAMSVAQR